MRKKLLSLLLAALMILGLLPAAALAAEGDAAPAVQAAEDVAVQADEETVDPPTIALPDGTPCTLVSAGEADGYKIYKTTVPAGTAEVAFSWGSLEPVASCPCGKNNTLKATFPLTEHNDTEEADVVDLEWLTQEQFNSIKTDGKNLYFALIEAGDHAALICIEVEADDSGSDNAITVTVDGTAYEVKNTGTVTADSKAAPIYKVVVPNGTAAVTVNWGLLVTRGSVACPCGACTVSLNDLKASNGTFALPLSDHSAEETAAVTKGYFASTEALQNIKDQAYHRMVFAWMRCKDADGNWCYALLCVEIEGVTNTAPALASGVTLYTVVAPDGETYTADVTKFFVDEDAGDTLTYYVSVNGGEFEKLEKPEAYTYTYGENFVNARLTFKANDGKADSLQNCTVILNNPEYPVVKGADSSTTNTTTGTAVRLSIGSLISHPQSISLNYFVSIDGGEYKQVTLSSNKYSYAPTKAGTHTLLFKASTAKTLEDGKTSGVYTWTVAATGADINNHAPIVQNPTEGPGQLGSGVNVTYWKPDLASIFSDPDGDAVTYSYSVDGSDFSEYYPTVGIHADYLAPDGMHTVTIRATDPYGEYAEFTVTIEKSTNHAPTKKADAPSSLSVFVPVGITYEVDANLYYEDVDAKDQGNLRFKSNRYGSAGKYTASAVGDTKTETAYGNDTSNSNAFSGIEITYTAIGIDDENAAITNGETYSLNLAELNFPGNYKVRINGGAEQDAAESYTFTPSKPGKYYLHFYGSQTKTAEQNYVVKLTVLPNGTEPAPMTVTIGEKNYDVKLTALVGSKSWFGGPDDVPFYLTAVPADFETLTLTVDKQDNTVKEVVCGEFEPVEGSGTVYTVKNHTCFTGDLDVNVSDVIDTSKYGVIPVLIQDTTGQYTVLLIQVGGTESETEFVPSIGNGAGSESTTTEGVTTFPAGSGSGAPTVTVTAPASGWAAGENTFTVACDKACVVLVKSGDTYTKLTAANSGETHSFTATLAEGDEIIVRLKGDVNGDGVVNNTDTIQARAASLGKATLTEINAACAKVVGGTAVTNTDVIQIGAVALGKAAFQW